MDSSAIEKVRPLPTQSLAVPWPSTAANAGIAPAEWTILAFFFYLAVYANIRGLAPGRQLALAAIPLAIYALLAFEGGHSRPWTRILREYLNLTLILAAYWSIELFAPSLMRGDLQDRWVAWDRILLDSFGLRRAIEALGPALPWVLETAYLSLYAIPPVFLTILYLTGSRNQSRRYLFVVLAGVLTVYSLLPFIPVDSPRVVYPGKDLPSFVTPPRQVNTWLLDHMDISTSVFPSGHVGVAFSTAFALFFAVPQRRKLQGAAFLAASLVFTATIYGRYHYSMDGVASIAVTSVVCSTASRWYVRR